MTTLPLDNIECYNIVFHGGTRGNFIGALMQCFIDNSPVYVSKYGSCHFDKRCGQNYDPASLSACNQAQYFAQSPKFKYLRPLDTSKPLIIMDHMIIDYDEFIEYFPNGKTIVITHTHDDLPSMRANLLFKNIIEHIDLMVGHTIINEYSSVLATNKKQATTIWKKFTSKYIPELESKLYSCHKLSKEEYRRYIDIELETLNHRVTFPPFEVQDKHKNNIFPLAYDVIVKDKNYVIDLISKLMNRPATDEVYISYDRYLSAQQLIYDKTGLI